MEKKNPYKFTLGFDKTKLTHVRAAEILNSVRDKADLIASAVVAHIDGGSTEKGAVLNQEALQIIQENWTGYIGNIYYKKIRRKYSWRIKRILRSRSQTRMAK